MSYGITPRQLKFIVNLYAPHNQAQEMKYVVLLKGEEALFNNLQTNPFQGISNNSIEERVAFFGSARASTLSNEVISILLAPLKHTLFKWILFVVTLSLVLSSLGSRSFLAPFPLDSFALLLTFLVNYAILLSLQYSERMQSHLLANLFLNNEQFNVMRDNTLRSVDNRNIVVGDVLELREGQTVPVDGWLVEGEMTVKETCSSKSEDLMKDTMRNCILALQDQIKQGKPPVCHKSPMVISGSKVVSGQARVIVLCVGKLCKMGEFAHLCQVEKKQLQSVAELKLIETYSGILHVAIPLLIVCLAGYLIRFLVEKLLWNQFSSSAVIEGCCGILICLESLVLLLSQGVLVGLGLGLKLFEWRLARDEIRVRASALPNLGVISSVCYDKEQEIKSVQYREWWNQTTENLPRPEDNQLITEINQKEIAIESNREFAHLMETSFFINYLQQLNDPYNPISTVNSYQSDGVDVYEEEVPNGTANYFCVDNMIKYIIVGLSDQFLFVKGDSREILDLCISLKFKSSGQFSRMTEDHKTIIKDVIKSMERRLLKTAAVAYKRIEPSKAEKKREKREDKIFHVTANCYTFLYLIGSSNIRDSHEYDSVRIFKQASISMIFCNEKPLHECSLKAQEVGITEPFDHSVALRGCEFQKLVGGLICNYCKKSICECKEAEYFKGRLKNIDDFASILPHFKVMGEAEYHHKFALILGLQNMKKTTAMIARTRQDLPAMRHTRAGIAIRNESQEEVAQLATAVVPLNSLPPLLKFVGWGRLSYDFLKKYIQLCLTASLVGVVFLMINLLFFKQYSFSVTEIIWVHFFLCPLLGLSLAFDRPSDELAEDGSKYYNQHEPLLSKSLMSRLIMQTCLQVMVLMVVLVSGQNYISEEVDSVDALIGADWSAKYNSASLDTIASGQLYDIFTGNPMYATSFTKYGVYSRHFTILFNIYVFMQIFNSFNCRKLHDRHINIFQGIKPLALLTTLFVVILQFIVITYGKEQFGLYPNGLSLEQWAFCIGLSMIVLVAGFLVKLIPSKSKAKVNEFPMWVNRSYNLAVKTCFSNKELLEFEVEENQKQQIAH